MNKLPKQEKYRIDIKKHLSAIICDLFSFFSRNPDGCLKVSLNRSNYKRSNNNSISYRHVKRVIDFLLQNDFIRQTKGRHIAENPKFSSFSKIYATAKLLNLIASVNSREIKQDLNRSFLELNETVFVNGISRTGKKKKFKRKKKLNFIPDLNTKKMERNLSFINELLMNTDIRIDDDYSMIDTSNKLLKRIFKKDFQHGGRFYGGFWQNIPKYLRKFILINGEPTVELDFSCYHVSMLYSLQGLIPPETKDLYYIGYSKDKRLERNFNKKAINIIFNSRNEENARAGVQQKVYTDTEDKLILPPEIPSCKMKDLKPIFDLLKKKHKQIEKYFFSGKGIDLQFLDSQIAEAIMMHFAKKKIAVLVMHDSFIIQEKYSNELKDKMLEIYKYYYHSDIGIKDGNIDLADIMSVD